MSPFKRVLSLTPAHIRAVHRDLPDLGPPAGQVSQTDADYADWVARIMATHPAPDQPTRLFAYGSLIWRPETGYSGQRRAVLHGWHRSFCLRQFRFRAMPDSPGLMMSLDEGGVCEGVLYDLPAKDLAHQLDRLFRREFTVKPNTNTPRWVEVETDTGPLQGLVFYMNRASPLYVPDLSPEEVAEVLAHSCGHLGTGAEYLLNTVTELEAQGFHDPYLWRLQELVAARIAPV